MKHPSQFRTALLAVQTFLTATNALKTCTVLSQYSSSDGKANDSPAIDRAFAECGGGGIIQFASGVEYNVFTPILAKDISNVEIHMLGNLNLPQNITYVQDVYNKTRTPGLEFFWFDLQGTNIAYLSTSVATCGWIRSYGQAWWDAVPPNGTSLPGRPSLMKFNVTSGRVEHFKSLKPIGSSLLLCGTDTTVSNTIIDAKSTSNSYPWNTDGIGVSGQHITITDSTVFNGDDAIVMHGFAQDVYVHRATVGFQTHGLSVGSLGELQSRYYTVSEIVFDDITVTNSLYGARFKSWKGGQGLAKNITWRNMRVENVTFPIFFTQDYVNQEHKDGPERPNNSSVMAQDFTWANFKGTINTLQPGDGDCVSDPCWYNAGLPPLKHTEAIIVECNTDTSCQGFATSGIQLVPQTSEPPTEICVNVSQSLNPRLGFHCGDHDVFVPTRRRHVKL